MKKELEDIVINNDKEYSEKQDLKRGLCSNLDTEKCTRIVDYTFDLKHKNKTKDLK